MIRCWKILKIFQNSRVLRDEYLIVTPREGGESSNRWRRSNLL